MEKIISLFQRNYETDRLVRDEVVPGAEWVLAGEGVATRKFDGTSCLIRDGILFKRYDAKAGRTPPEGFEPAQPNPDPVSGHWPGWVPILDGPEDSHHRDAWEFGYAYTGEEGGMTIPLTDGTYELCGPKVQGNPDGFPRHVLVAHGKAELPDAPRDFEGIKSYLAERNIEGIVWHHPDGRMVKIKKRDFFKPEKRAK